MRVVIDSNILVSIIGKKSRLRAIWDAFIEGRFDMYVSEDILKEYEEILQEHAAPGADEIVLEIFAESPSVHFQHIYYAWNAITADPDDNKFFDVAVASNATYLVTNDRHFDVVKKLPFPKIKILTSEEFFNLLHKV